MGGAGEYSISKEKADELTLLAEKIDRHETQEIKLIARQAIARHEAIRELISRLKAERLEHGITLAEAGEKSGIGKANLCRLENQDDPNPTLDTLLRYAQAVGRTIDFGLEYHRVGW